MINRATFIRFGNGLRMSSESNSRRLVSPAADKSCKRMLQLWARFSSLRRSLFWGNILLAVSSSQGQKVTIMVARMAPELKSSRELTDLIGFWFFGISSGKIRGWSGQGWVEKIYLKKYKEIC